MLRRSADVRETNLPELPTPNYTDVSDCLVGATCFDASSGTKQWYPPVMVGAPALGQTIVASTRYVEQARALLGVLEVDDYSRYMADFYAEGVSRFGDRWGYADIVTVVLGLAELLRPRRYLEIGVRRGRSVCAVASNTPDCDMAMFDMWIPNYAGMDNPGPRFVQDELAKVNHRGAAEFVDGDSHETLPRYFERFPQATFDLVTVDGDHSEAGAAQDLCDVLPHLSIGGGVVFDDICHPDLPGLSDVWQRLVVGDPRFSSWGYEEVGYGVGFAIRKW